MTDMALWHEVQEWQRSKRDLEEFKNTEQEQRIKLAQRLFPDPVKGTQRFSLGGDYGNVKLVFGYNYSLGDKDKAKDGFKVPIYDQVVELEDSIRKLGSRADDILERLIRWKPELVEKEYLALGDTTLGSKIKELVDANLKITVKTPALEYEPKA